MEEEAAKLVPSKLIFWPNKSLGRRVRACALGVQSEARGGGRRRRPTSPIKALQGNGQPPTTSKERLSHPIHSSSPHPSFAPSFPSHPPSIHRTPKMGVDGGVRWGGGLMGGVRRGGGNPIRPCHREPSMGGIRGEQDQGAKAVGASSLLNRRVCRLLLSCGQTSSSSLHSRLGLEVVAGVQADRESQAASNPLPSHGVPNGPSHSSSSPTPTDPHL